MTINNENINDRFDLNRFVTAQENTYEQAVAEIKTGQKKTHWMWFIFPQIEGLGRSPTAIRYAIKSRDEAEAYLKHPILGSRLVECVNVLLNLDGYSALQIFGNPDTEKMRSSMTLFASISQDGSQFHKVLGRYYDGTEDGKTLKLLGGHGDGVQGR